MPTQKSPKAVNPDKQIRNHVISLLKGGNAHVTFDAAVKGLSPELRGVRPDNLPYSAWEQLEHIRIAQWDILEFSTNSNYKPLQWPKDYWPPTPEPPSTTAWNKSIKQVRDDLAAMIALIKNPKTDLYSKIPWGDGQTILREALLIADHTAYHLGELIAIRKSLKAWK